MFNNYTRNNFRAVVTLFIKIERIYEVPNRKGDDKNNGFRILVDRLWPRGLSKNAVDVDMWIKDVAPSTSLRKWFNHDEKNGMNLKQDILRNLRNTINL
jgi:uncharacterized protein YeaO (DUF488 family)